MHYGIDLEIVYMINLGGTKIDSGNDTLWMVWEIVQKHLKIKTTTKNASINPNLIKYNSLISDIISPNMVYATTHEMVVSAPSIVNPKFQHFLDF